MALTSTLPNPYITSFASSIGFVNQSFNYQITTSNPATSYAATGLPAGLMINTNSGLISGTPTALGVFMVQLSATNATSTETLDLELEIINATPIPGAGAALGGGLTFYGSGDANWFAQNTTTRDGSALQSGAITDNETSSLITTIQGPARASFFWKVDSEFGYDELSLYVDGVLNETISGDVDWTQKMINLGAGTHTLKVTYQKDINTAEGADAGWLDSFEVDYAPDPPTGFTATDGTVDNSVDLSWQASAGATEYNIFRSTDPNVTGSLLATIPGGTLTYSDTTAIPGTVYYYTLTAGNTNGESSGATNSGFPTPPFLPDIQLRTSPQSSYRGNQVYNTSGSGQTLRQIVKRKAAKIYFLSENDGSSADDIQAQGTKGNRYIKAKYYKHGPSGRVNVTAAMTSGIETATLASHQQILYEIKMTSTKASRAGRKKRTFLTTLSSTGDPAKVDRGKIKAKARN